MPAATASLSSTTHLPPTSGPSPPEPNSASLTTTSNARHFDESKSSALKRKWELAGNSNPSSPISKKKYITQKSLINNGIIPSSDSPASVKKSASVSSMSLSKTSNNGQTSENSTTNSNKSDASLSAFHRSMFQSFVKNSLDDLEKVCYADCGKINRMGRKKIVLKPNEFLKQRHDI